jgi:hypothetical protein
MNTEYKEIIRITSTHCAPTAIPLHSIPTNKLGR